MDENLFNPIITEQMSNKSLNSNPTKITVIGVGGGGCNMIDHMISQGIYQIDLISANTDLQSLKSSKAPKKIQLGLELTKGEGAGGKPEIGRDSALESYEEIKESLTNSDMVFIAVGLGGGTGTGAASIVAKAAREVGALCIAVATKPFHFESKKRMGLANLGLEELKKVTDSIIVIKNEKLIREVIDENTGLKDAFKIVDNILYQAVNGITEIILNPGKNDINSDFADIRNIMQYKGVALMGIGRGKGENYAMSALENAIKSPLLDEVALNKAQGIMIHWTVNPNIPLFIVDKIMGEITNKLSDTTLVIFGTTTDNAISKDEVKITIIATGFNPTDEILISKDEKIETNIVSNLTPSDPQYYDTPPLLRGYSIKYQL